MSIVVIIFIDLRKTNERPGRTVLKTKNINRTTHLFCSTIKYNESLLTSDSGLEGTYMAISKPNSGMNNGRNIQESK
jgi:hypothetical protein